MRIKEESKSKSLLYMVFKRLPMWAKAIQHSTKFNNVYREVKKCS